MGSFNYQGNLRPNVNQWPIGMIEEDQKDRTSQLVMDFLIGQMAREMTEFVDDDGRENTR